ncbi:MAG: cupin domain-containing protein [Actinomycetota bacterium]|nr:cupin domain-containing protein [Actinomycetota bacterium]
MSKQQSRNALQNAPFHTQAPGRVIKWAVPGTPPVELAVLAEGWQTDGRITVSEHRYPAGYEIGLHTHLLEDEGFFVAEGTVVFPMPDDDVEFTATAGEFVWHPVRRRHGLRVSDDGPARLIQFQTPGTNTVPEFFERLSDGASPEVTEVLRFAREDYGIYLDAGPDSPGLPPRVPSANHGPLTADGKLIVPPGPHVTNQPFKSDKNDVRPLKIGRGMMSDVRATFHAFGAQTGNAFGLVEIQWGPGDIAGAHIHTLEDEGFYLLEGELTLKVATPDGVITAVARAGDFVWAPRELPHYYVVSGEKGARVLVFEVPGGSLTEFFLGVSEGQGADIETDEQLMAFARWSAETAGVYFMAPGEFPE